MKKSRRLIPDAQVRDRYGVHISTLYNWDRDPKLGFPKPIRINNRKFRDEAELDQFDRARAAKRNENAA
jgi:predicted DNA-binding transcriptional regulator AlpA